MSLVIADNCCTTDVLADYLAGLKDDPISREEEIKLFIRIKDGDKLAREEVIMHNRRLVVSIAKRYATYYRNIELIDLVQEGNCGLVYAVGKYDYTKEAKFPTYATYWIRQFICKFGMDKGEQVRLPAYLTSLTQRVRKQLSLLEIEKGFEPSVADRDRIIDELPDVTEAAKLLLKDAFNMFSSLAYLDSKASAEADGDATIGSIIPADGASVEDLALTQIKHDDIVSVLEMLLTERELFIIKKRFGIDEDFPHTLEQIAGELNLTRERIRQIEIGAMRKLRQTKGRRLLYDYYTA